MPNNKGLIFILCILTLSFVVYSGDHFSDYLNECNDYGDDGIPEAIKFFIGEWFLRILGIGCVFFAILGNEHTTSRPRLVLAITTSTILFVLSLIYHEFIFKIVGFISNGVAILFAIIIVLTIFFGLFNFIKSKILEK